MPQMSIKQFAGELGVLPTVLLEQLRAAGVSKHLTADSLTEQDKSQLLDYLRKIHGSRVKKIKVCKKRTGRATQITTQFAGIRLEGPLTAIPVEEGTCSGCSQVALRKIVSTNQGALALCTECVRKALKRHKKWMESQQLSLKKKWRGKFFIRVFQGGAPGLGKRSS